MNESIVSDFSDDAERVQELTLRPKNLHEFVGQKRVASQVNLLLTAARSRNTPADHILLSVHLDLVKQHWQ